MIDFLHEAQQLFPYTQALRRDFHMHPELGHQEVRTAGIVAKELQSLGLEVTTGVGKTGVVAMIEGSQPGPVILLRADMDALPIHEETGAEYASRTPGVMHACGHDAHTAILLTAARLLHTIRHELPGSVKLVFQPAEEGMGGAEGMIADGVLDNPKVDVTLGLHIWNEQPLGWLGLAAGPTMAGTEIFKLRIKGKGGHGAIPNLAVDPILAGAHVVNALQSIVARNTPPLKAAVVSVTTFHGGEAFNVIPPQVELTGTIRTFDLEIREMVLRRFDEIVQGVAHAMGCQVESQHTRMTPALINDAQAAQVAQETARHLLPDSQIETNGPFTMGGEDFAYMMEKVPGLFMFVGSANPQKGLDYGHHHPKFDFDEAAMPRAAALMAATAIELLRKHSL
ncbi:MAG: amidohydrolase [Anaerolineae bacterium]|nr:MAG: amidohydrolase [Anaerolineae bacterium]